MEKGDTVNNCLYQVEILADLPTGVQAPLAKAQALARELLLLAEAALLASMYKGRLQHPKELWSVFEPGFAVTRATRNTYVPTHSGITAAFVRGVRVSLPGVKVDQPGTE